MTASCMIRHSLFSHNATFIHLQGHDINTHTKSTCSVARTLPRETQTRSESRKFKSVSAHAHLGGTRDRNSFEWRMGREGAHIYHTHAHPRSHCSSHHLPNLLPRPCRFNNPTPVNKALIRTFASFSPGNSRFSGRTRREDGNVEVSTWRSLREGSSGEGSIVQVEEDFSSGGSSGSNTERISILPEEREDAEAGGRVNVSAGGERRAENEEERDKTPVAVADEWQLVKYSEEELLLSSRGSLDNGILRDEIGEEPNNGPAGWLDAWEVPWGGKELGIGMGSWLVSFIGSSLVIHLTCYKLGWQPWKGDFDEQSGYLLLGQTIRTALGLFVIRSATRTFEPLSADFFRIGVGDSLSVRSGWLLWAGIGLAGATGAVQLVALATSALTGGAEAPREETDALLQILPLIAYSPFSTASLIAVAGFCAPVLEEVVFRGFLMTSLTKWLPLPAAALISALAFAAAHLTPTEFPKLATLGFVLGLAYARTRNLATPILMHAIWNSGIIILLTVLRMEGFNIEELL